ncbi:MAG TPA: hypothetical protein VJT72_15150, partial [Pseudonocardiaceae bacterium]|nr:hypothetical protein [Pseudonocardiaceae bacterium]
PLLVGVALLAAFVVWERRVRAPLVRFEILRVRSLRAASLAVGATALAFTSIVYLGTLYLRNALDYGALKAGVALLPIDVVALLVSLVAAAPLPAVPHGQCCPERPYSSSSRCSGSPAHPSRPTT